MKEAGVLKRKPLIFLLTCLLLSVVPATIALAETDLGQNVFGRGGNSSLTAGNLRIRGTMGQSTVRASLHALGQVAGFSPAMSQLQLPGTSFTVTKTADTNDGVCNADCSLREAITAANANPGLDTIAFSIGSGLQTISPTSALPAITSPVVIDGTTQPGFNGTPLIDLDGTNAGDVGCLNITAGGSTVKGLIIGGFRFAAIQLSTNGNNVISGNYIGTNAAGTAEHSGNPSDEGGTENNGVGIIVGTSNNIIGGTTAAERNLISGNENSNGSAGIDIQSGVTGNKVIGNYIGTDVTGTSVIPNGSYGVMCESDSTGTIIGGSSLAERNIIAGGIRAIWIRSSHSNKVMGNQIGLNANIQTSNGVEIDGTSHDNVIGGVNPGEGNVIAFNSQKAVTVFNSAVRNSILGNSIYSNDFGIDLAFGPVTVTPNDLNDPDTGPNLFQNFPLITSTVLDNGSTTINGTLNSVSNTQYRIEVFSNPSCNSSGNGEGKVFLGASSLFLASNDGNFSLSVPGNLLATVLTATATDQFGNTSEFSPCFAGANAGGTLQFVASSSTIGEGGLANLVVQRVNGSTGAASVQYQTISGTASTTWDFASTSGTLHWADGDSADKVISVPTVGDLLDEQDESLTIELKSPTGAILGNQSSTVLTIIDDDPPPKLSIANLAKGEGNSGTTAFDFLVTLSDANGQGTTSGQTITFNYATVAGGTATLGNDYQPANALATIPAGASQTTVRVFVNGETQEEPDETFLVGLSNPTNATIQVAQATGTILNDDNVGSPTLQFSQAIYNIHEDLGALTITVTRSGDATGTSSVYYNTKDDTATQKSDFEFAAGQLTFEPGATSKTFTLLLNEDMYVEGSEMLSVVLSNPVGATLGQQSTASVVIADDLPESLTDPIDDAQSFVHMHYHDFLNREPDPAGLAFWTNEITSCGGNAQCIDVKRVNVSAAFFLSIEFQETGYLVYRTYKAAYGNLPGAPIPIKLEELLPDTQEIGHGVQVNQQGWQQQLENNKEAFMLELVQRPRFAQTNPTSLSPSAFVDQLFAHAGVVPTTFERDLAIAEFDGNSSDTTDMTGRARALRDVAENGTLTQQEFNRAFVLMQYFGYLRRNPNDAPEAGLNFDGFNFWLNKLNQFNGNYADAEMVKAFIASGEYRHRFGP